MNRMEYKLNEKDDYLKLDRIINAEITEIRQRELISPNSRHIERNLNDFWRNIIMNIDLRTIEKDGWMLKSSGVYQSSNQLRSYDSRFMLLVRKRNFQDFLKKSSKDKSNFTQKSRLFLERSNGPMGVPTEELTPSSDDMQELSRFFEFPSLMATRKNRDSLIIGYDSEWVSTPNGCPRKIEDMLSWQFSLIHNGEVLEYVFLRKSRYGLSLELALAIILESLGYKPLDNRRIRKTSLASDENGQISDETVDTSSTDASFETISVTLVCHAGKADISAFDQSWKRRKKILKDCHDVQGGLITLQPIFITPVSTNPVHGRNTMVFPVSLSVADTMCHAPAGNGSLKILGDAVGIPKVELPSEPINYIEHMDLLLKDNPCLYLNYASNDSLIALIYLSALYGINHSSPVTLTSAAAKMMRESIIKYLGCENMNEYNRKYRGLMRKGHGLVHRLNGAGYIESSSLEAISDRANTVQYYASQAFRGGYNSCSDVGFYDQITYDYDLRNAYPTALCLVPDIDWENPVKFDIVNRELHLQDWLMIGSGYNPVLPFVAYVRFEFPENIKYPCIPVNVEGIPVFPRTSDGLDGVYACGPELYLALRLGAKIFCERGYVLNSLLRDDYSESYSMRSGVYQLVKDRTLAKCLYGKGSLEELILKTMVNSIYGKTAQNVIEKYAWSARSEEMEALDCSSITNPVSACMVTSIVRAALLAAENQAADQGYMTCSVTTDGFISDMPLEVLTGMDLMGLRIFLEKARLYLTDNVDPEIWEIKHRQNDLVNFTTRGNISLIVEDKTAGIKGGVCAHNGAKSPYEPDSYEDRMWLMKAVLSRTGTVDYTAQEWIGFRELSQGDGFTVKSVTKHIRMDYDLKRKPDRNSFYTVFPVIDGEAYEIANFSTVPFENVAEYRNYRTCKKNTTVLRTMNDWTLFWMKLDSRSSGAKIRDLEWSKLMSCIMGYRAGMWDIPGLTAIQNRWMEYVETMKSQKKPQAEISRGLHMIEDICDWINLHNRSRKTFKESDWKNARRPDRQANMLPAGMIDDLLLEMQAG